MDTSPDDLDRIRAACTRWLAWHGDRSPAEQLAAVPADVDEDVYGDGGVVAELEREVAALLGKPAAAFFVSGTMAQQVALRIHADLRDTRVVAYHPTSHLELHELRGFERLHDLVGRPVGPVDALLSLSDLEDVAEPLAALLLELPQREIGGLLPEWDDLVDQTTWARDGGIATHLDGARLWQCGVAYDRSLAEIADLFDTVYVSFYKDLGGLTGSCLVGDEDVIAEAREWRHRHGGTLYAMWPYAASCLDGLRTRLPRMASYRDHARAIAGALAGLDGVRVVPDPPTTSLFHLLLRGTEEGLRDAALDLARDAGVWTWSSSAASGHPDWRRVELTVGDATLDLTPGEVRSIVARLVASPGG